MKTEKFKLLILIIIALNLTFLSFSELGFPITKAYATNEFTNEINSSLIATNEFTNEINSSLIAINDDGSINIKLSEEQLNEIKAPEIMDVNIAQIANAIATYFFVDDAGAFWLNTRDRKDY